MPVVTRPTPALEGDGAAMTSLPAPGLSAAAVARPIAPAGVRPGGGAAAPIVSAQPLRARVQRAPLTLPQHAGDGSGAGATGPAAAGPATSGGPVKIHRDGEAGQTSSALEARSFTHGGEIFLPASHGPLTSGTGKALLAHELTHVTQQRRLGSSLPAEHTPHGKSLEAEAVAAERSPDMSLAKPSSGGAAATATLSSTGADVPSTAPTTQPAPQRAPADGSPAPRTQGSKAGSSGASGSSGQAHSEQELEVLAHQLYQRIGRHLRRELLVDRERVGFALDLP
jgi:hypothetical protein